MSERETPRSSAITPGDTEIPVLVAERLADAVGESSVAEPAGAALRRAVEEIPGSWDTVWLDRLQSTARQLGFHATPALLAPSEVMAGLRPGHPAVLRRPAANERDGWTLLLDRRWGKVYRAGLGGEGSWVGIDQLAEDLASPANQPLPWLLCEPGVVRPGEASHATHLSPARRLLELVRPDRADLWSIVVFGVLVGGLSLATPIAVQQLVNSVALGGLVQPVVILALMLFAGLTFAAAMTAFQSYVAEIVQRRIFVRVVGDLADRLPRVDISAFDQRHGPELINRFFDVMTVQKIGASLLLDGVALVLQTVMGLLLLSFYHPLMLAFSVVLIGGIAFVVLVVGRGAVRTAITESKNKYEVANWLEEMAREPAPLRGSGAATFAFERADDLTRQYLRARRDHYRIVFRQLTGALALQVFASAGLLGLGGGLVIAGQLTLGQLVASELIVTAIVASFAKLGKHLESLYDLLAAVDKLGYLFDLPLERNDGAVQELASGGARVAFHDLHYAMKGTTILEGVSFDVAAGEKIAVTGPAGAGKSTLLELLAGLRPPDRGYIAIDGDDLRSLNLSWLRDQITYIGGADVLEGTIEDNLRLGRPYISNAAMRDALDRIGILESIADLPDGLKTYLSPDGSPLSRSQVLRLGLARAIAAKPRLILIDEVLESLDERALERSLAALLDPTAPWTLIVACSRSAIADRFERSIRLGDLPPQTGSPSATRGVEP